TWFDISMYHTFLMGVSKPIENLLKDAEETLGRQTLSDPNLLLQGLTVDKLHDDVRDLTIGDTIVVDDDEVGMTQPRCRLCLHLKALTITAFASGLLVEDLDSECCVGVSMTPLVDSPHATFAEARNKNIL